MGNRWGDSGNSDRLYFLGCQIHCRWWLKPWNEKLLSSSRKTMTNLDSISKKQRHYFEDKGLSSQSYGFSSSHVRMWELDYKDSWVPRNWCFWTVVLEKTVKSPWACKEIQPVNPKGNQCWGWSSNTLATWCEQPTHWKSPWCWERLKAGGEGDDRGEDGGMASPTRQTWVWVNFGSWWWAEKPGVPQSVRS